MLPDGDEGRKRSFIAEVVHLRIYFHTSVLKLYTLVVGQQAAQWREDCSLAHILECWSENASFLSRLTTAKIQSLNISVL